MLNWLSIKKQDITKYENQFYGSSDLLAHKFFNKKNVFFR